MNTDAVIYGLTKPINPFVSSILAVLTVSWGLWVASPFWHAFSGAQSYRYVAELAPEWVWGLYAFMSGVAMLCALYSRKPGLLVASSLLSSLHWGTISIMFWFGDWTSIAGLTYSFVALYSSFIMMNVYINYVDRGIERL